MVLPATAQLGVPPSGGFLEIGNINITSSTGSDELTVPPSGGFLEIGNPATCRLASSYSTVPPSGGFLEIGNTCKAI